MQTEEFSHREVFPPKRIFWCLPSLTLSWAGAGEWLLLPAVPGEGWQGTSPGTSHPPARARALFQLFPPGDPADLTQALACHFPAPGFCSELLLSKVSSAGLGWQRDAEGLGAAGVHRICQGHRTHTDCV